MGETPELRHLEVIEVAARCGVTPEEMAALLSALKFPERKAIQEALIIAEGTPEGSDQNVLDRALTEIADILREALEIPPSQPEQEPRSMTPTERDVMRDLRLKRFRESGEKGTVWVYPAVLKAFQDGVVRAATVWNGPGDGRVPLFPAQREPGEWIEKVKGWFFEMGNGLDVAGEVSAAGHFEDWYQVISKDPTQAIPALVNTLQWIGLSGNEDLAEQITELLSHQSPQREPGEATEWVVCPRHCEHEGRETKDLDWVPPCEEEECPGYVVKHDFLCAPSGEPQHATHPDLTETFRQILGKARFFSRTEPCFDPVLRTMDGLTQALVDAIAPEDLPAQREPTP